MNESNKINQSIQYKKQVARAEFIKALVKAMQTERIGVAQLAMRSFVAVDVLESIISGHGEILDRSIIARLETALGPFYNVDANVAKEALPSITDLVKKSEPISEPVELPDYGSFTPLKPGYCTKIVSGKKKSKPDHQCGFPAWKDGLCRLHYELNQVAVAKEREQSDEPNEVLARCLLDAAEAYENSYDSLASDLATSRAEHEKSADPDNPYAGLVDYSQFYQKTLHQICEEVASSKSLDSPVYLLLSYAWNDAIMWAREILKIEASVYTIAECDNQ